MPGQAKECKMPPHPFVTLADTMSQHLYLLWQLGQRDIASRYRGSALGILWAVLSPLLLLVIYTFVFSVVFQARWGQASDSKTFFAMNLFAGMILHGFLGECMSRATGVIQQHGNYVKRVVFPLRLLPLTLLGTALFHAVISLLVLVAVYALLGGTLHWQLAGLPAVLLPLLLFTMGTSLGLAALGVFVRDLGQIMPMLITVMLFTAPVFYPVSALPEQFQGWLRLNPLTTPIEMTRALLFEQQWPDLMTYGQSLLVACSVLLLGDFLFKRLRPGFADAL